LSRTRKCQPNFYPRLISTRRIQLVLEPHIQLPDAQRAPVHRAEHLHIPDRIEAKLGRNPYLDHLHKRGGNVFRIFPVYHEEVGFSALG